MGRLVHSGLRLGHRLNERCEAYVELRHTVTESLHHRGQIRSGDINLSEGIGLGTGVIYRF